MSSELESLERRLGDIISSRCNSIGCRNCDLKWDGGCSAVELQNEIHMLDMAETFDARERDALSAGV